MNRPLRSLMLTLLAATVGFGLAQQQGGTLIAAWAQDPVGLDPHVTSAYSSFQILENVLDTLVELDEELTVQPSLATDWSVSDDGLTWTFNLRDDAQFSNGRAFTADDVVFTYERMLDPETGSGNAYKIAGVTAVEAVDDHTVQFTLDAPNAAFLGHLGLDKSVGIIARESVEDGTINTSPIGTGPFMITEYQPGTSVLLERNPNYWRDGLPYLDAVDIRILPDETVRRSALVSGDIHWTISIPTQALEDLRARHDITVDEIAAPAYWYIGVNLEREPMSDVRVRQAISFALNRDDITEASTFGTGTLTQDPIPSDSRWSFDYAPYPQDLEQARALLEDAGVGGGFDLEVMPTTQYEESIRISQVLQAMLAPLNINVSIRTLEWADWLETQGAGDYDTYVCSWNGLVDPDDYYYAQHKTGEVFNFTGYSNTTVDELLEEGRRTADFDERYEIYEEINQIIVDEAPYIYLYNPQTIHAYVPAVMGFQALPNQAIDFSETWLDR